MTDNFTCPRTCPQFGDRWCRFRPILDHIGPILVDSETVRIVVKIKDRVALEEAVKELGGTMIGEGIHSVYTNKIFGLGFRLPKWRYPLVLGGDDGSLSYDNYGGTWGDAKDIDRLNGEYSLQVAASRARDLGWQHEKTSEGLRVYHPNGGHMEVTRHGSAEAFGFNGVGCHDALLALGVEGTVTAKPELGRVECKVGQQI